MSMSASVVEAAGRLTVFGFQNPLTLFLFDPILAASNHDDATSSFGAPMPGKIAAIEVKAGDEVTKGDALVVVEAMKMEHTIIAPRDGVIEELMCSIGDQVDEGEELLKMTE